MIPRHKEREFKVMLAAYVRREHNETGKDIKDALLDIENEFRRKGMDTFILGVDGLFKTWNAYYQFTYDNADDIQDVLNDIAESNQEYAKTYFDRYIYGGEIKEGGSGVFTDELPDATKEPSTRTEHEPDARFKRREDIESVALMLDCFAAELLADPSRRAVLIRTYAESIVVGKQ